jgi:hypothetical protein
MDAGEGGGKAGRGGNGDDGHPRLPQDRRVHEDDIGHRQEGGGAAQHFRPYRAAVGGEAEMAIEPGGDAHARIIGEKRLG